MRIHLLLDQKPMTDLDRISGKNLTNRLVRLVQELAKLVTETNSKMQEPKTCDEAINNPIHGNRWREIVNEEL